MTALPVRAAPYYWKPRWGKHVSQIHKDGSGWNDCGEASLARALLEYDPLTPLRKKDTQWDLIRAIHDPKAPQGPLDLINELSIIARGHADQPTNGFTDGAGIQRILVAYGLDKGSGYYDQQDGSSRAYKQAYQRPLSLCWVDGVRLAPASFPASFFGGDWGYDHLILWLPYAGQDNLFNDPLTVTPDQQTDVQYDLAAVNAAMGGVWLLPTPENLAQPTYVTTKHVGLKPNPNHIGKATEQIAAGQPVTKMGVTSGDFIKITSPTGNIGWVASDAVGMPVPV